MRFGSTITVLVSIALLLVEQVCFADGKVFVREEVSATIPYQRAFILCDEGKETLILQSKLETAEAGSTMGWVVPVPSVPELASMDPSQAYKLFWMLDRSSAPKVIRSRSIFQGIVLIIILSAFAVSVVQLVVSFLPCGRNLKEKRISLERAVISTVLLLVLFVVAVPSLLSARGELGIEILSSETVGIYDTTVLRADDSTDLIEWLNQNGFAFENVDEVAFDDYVEKNWCFVAAKVGYEVPEEFLGIEDGLLDPLILRFETEKPVYPLALTSTIGVDTEVLIYFLSNQKMQCENRLELQYAGDFNPSNLRRWSHGEDDFSFLEWEKKLDYLCKFKGILTPKEMRKDLIFSCAPDNKPYRKRIFR